MADGLDIIAVRNKFPALSGQQVFFDNAGGSQTLGSVIESIRNYLSSTNVQLGASYEIARKSTSLYIEGYEAAAKYLNADPAEVVIGSSATQLLRNLSFAFDFCAGDEVVISLIDHETNIDPWIDMAERIGMTVKWWKPTNGPNPRLQAQDLNLLLSERTRLVACTHSSNLLGTIHDIKSIAKAVHKFPGALLCVDGVAYAPHRQIDVQNLGIDFYVFSWYKVYGPHISMLYGRRESQKDIKFLGHYFNPNRTLADKLALAGTNYELLHGIPSIVQYFDSESKKVWHDIATHEEELARILLKYLTSREDITVYGEISPDSNARVPTISFTVKDKSSRSIVEEAERTSNLGFRWGHFFSYRLVTEVLGLKEDGVVRVSMVHYNTVQEVEQLVQKLKEILA